MAKVRSLKIVGRYPHRVHHKNKTPNKRVFPYDEHREKRSTKKGKTKKIMNNFK